MLGSGMEVWAGGRTKHLLAEEQRNLWTEIERTQMNNSLLNNYAFSIKTTMTFDHTLAKLVCRTLQDSCENILWCKG